MSTDDPPSSNQILGSGTRADQTTKMAGDPWSWTNAEVCQFFSEKAQKCLNDRPHTRLPSREHFIKTLQANDIDGATLLSDVDCTVLRDELGVTSFGQRNAVLECIKRLRNASSTIREKASISANVDTITEISGTIPQSLPFSTSCAQAAARTLTPSPAHFPIMMDHVEDAQRASSVLAKPTSRIKETVVIDKHGKKRRKLELTASDSPPLPLSSSCPINPLPSFGYLPQTARDVDEIFYGSQAYGEHLDNDFPPPACFVFPDDDTSRRDANFTYVQHCQNLGTSLTMWNRIRHFMRNVSQVEYPFSNLTPEIPAKDGIQLVFRPYRTNTLKRMNNSATVYRYDNGSIVSFRQKADLVSSGFSTCVEYQTETPLDEEFAHLLQKWPATAELVPSSDESEIADEVDDKDQDSECESQASVDSAVPEARLTQEEIKQAITAAKEGIVQKWVTKFYPVKDSKVRSEWRKTQGSRYLRQELIARSSRTISAYHQRLERIEQQLLAHEWGSFEAMTKACQALEPTVTSLEEENWRISVWRQRKPPSIARVCTTNQSIQNRTQKRDKTFDEFLIPDASSVEDDPLGPDALAPVSSHQESRSDTSVDGPVVAHLFEDSKTGITTPLSPCGRSESSCKSELESVTPLRVRQSQDTQCAHAATQASSKTNKTETSTEPRIRSISKETPTYASQSSAHFLASTSEAIEQWSLKELIRRKDRARILLKLVHKAGSEFRKNLFGCLRSFSPEAFRSRLRHALEAVAQGKCLEGPNGDLMGETAELAIAWYTAKVVPAEPDSKAELCRLALERPPFPLQHFYDLLKSMIDRKSTRLFVSVDARDVVEISSDDDDDNADVITPSKKVREKKKKERAKRRDQAAIDIRNTALDRQHQYQEAVDEVKAVSTNVNAQSELVINPLQIQHGHAPIFIPANLARVLKAHQIDGVRFLWREITAFEDGVKQKPQGCVLAHAMGLGKTLQTIALLVVVSLAAASTQSSVRNQVPKRFRRHCRDTGARLRITVLCPPTLRQNWCNEIRQWTLTELGVLYPIEQTVQLSSVTLTQWATAGGVLIIGYQLFQRLADDKNLADKEIIANIWKESDIVVADEAHMLKNARAAVSIAARRFETQSRIALTGTPMSNDIQEVYSLMSWCAPDYLGPPKEFQEHFAEPIKNGTYVESTAAEKRKSLKRLRGLKSEIGPKVHRVDVTALRDQLPTKIEFNIEICLTPEQTDLYHKCLEVLHRPRLGESIKTSFLFGWMAMLSVLTNHPIAFKRKLQVSAGSTPKTKSSPRDETDTMHMSTAATAVAATQSALQFEHVEGEDADHHSLSASSLGFDRSDVDAILASIDDSIDPERSVKSAILMKIVEYADVVQDRVLVFSGSLLTLDYVGNLLTMSKVRFERVDGSVAVSRRNEILERFQRDKIRVLLISTRAGGVGLNIQGANRVVILDFGFNPMWEQQAVGRAYRLGQTKRVYVYRFVAGGTFEASLYNTQLAKTSVTSRVVDDQNPRRHASRYSLDMFGAPRPVPQTDVAQWAEKDAEVLGRILSEHSSDPADTSKRDTGIRKITTMETLNADAEDEPLTVQEQEEVDIEIQSRFTGRVTRRTTREGKGVQPASGTQGTQGDVVMDDRSSPVLVSSQDVIMSQQGPGVQA